MSWVLKAHTAIGDTGSGGNTTSAIDTTGADLIVIHLAWYHPNGPENISDSNNNTWTEITSGFIPIGGALYYCQAPIVGPGHTFSSTSPFANIAVQAWSGSTALPLDQDNVGIAASPSSSIQPGSVTPGQANELVISGFSVGNSSGSISIDSGFTITDVNTFGSTFGVQLAYLVQTSATPENPTWTTPGGTSFGYVATIATFKGSAATIITPCFGDVIVCATPA